MVINMSDIPSYENWLTCVVFGNDIDIHIIERTYLYNNNLHSTVKNVEYVVFPWLNKDRYPTGVSVLLDVDT